MNANATVNICVRVIVRFILFCERYLLGLYDFFTQKDTVY